MIIDYWLHHSFIQHIFTEWGSLVAQMVKNLPAMQETHV